jgi:tetratricopeptide (TPR) repeat protein
MIVLAVTVLGYGLSLRPEHASSAAYSAVLSTSIQQQLDDALRVRPDDPTAMVQLAEALRAAEPAAGRRYLEALGHAYPRSSATLTALASAELADGATEAALLHALRAVSAEPGSAIGHLTLGEAIAANDAGRMQDAIREWDLALQADPGSEAGQRAAHLIRAHEAR